MKKTVLIAFALVFLVALFLWSGSKHKEHGEEGANSGHHHHQTQSEEATSKESQEDSEPLQLSENAVLKNAWITAPPPGSSVVAAYMTISNSGQTDTKVVAVESDDFEEMMFHKTVIDNGVASMQHLELLEVPSNGSLTLEPNGMHIMAMEPERELKAGDEVSIRFTFDNGETHSATVPVR